MKDVKGKKSSAKRTTETRRLSKEKTKFQEESKADAAKRKERQQKLYESAIKQTITMLSPVKEPLSTFPVPKDKIMVKTEGDKIIIETEFQSKAEDHVLIAKSPRKLDTSLVKFSRSFDEGRVPEKLDKANRSFEDRNKSFEDSEKCETPEAMKISRKNTKSQEVKQKIEGAVVYKKFDGKSNSLEKPAEHHYLGADIKAKSLDDKKQNETKKTEAAKPVVRSATGDRRMFAHQYNVQEVIDMQAVISERRSLEILKRSLPSEEMKENECSSSRKASTAESLDSYVSADDSHSPQSKSPVPPVERDPQRVPTIECEEASIEEDENSEIRHLRVLRTDTNRLSLDRSRSDETGSWMTVECDEFVGSDTSDNEPRTLEPDRYILEAQATLEDAVPLEYSNCATPTSELNILITSPNTSPLIEKSVIESFENQISPTESQKKTMLEKHSDGSKSGDSWTSGEKDNSPLRVERHDWNLSIAGGKEKSSIDEESSLSCSIARPLGISQDFGIGEEKKCLEIKEKMLKLDIGTTEAAAAAATTTTSTMKEVVHGAKLSGKKVTTPQLEKQSPIDLGTSTEMYLERIEEKISKLIQGSDESDLNTNDLLKTLKIEKPARMNPGKKLAVVKADAGKSGSDRSSQDSKSSFDSKGSFETESSSGSMGAAQRRGELHIKEQQSTWRPFSIESSASSNTDDTWHHVDTDGYERYDANNPLRDSSDSDLKEEKENDSSFQDELNDFPTNFGYPAMTSSVGGIGVNPTDIIGFSPGFTIGRTLSRISERSTASEKSSIEDDVSKASTHSASLRDESAASTDHQPSISSDSRSNTNLAYISDADRRTSAEMPEIPCDSATGERLSSMGCLNEPKSPTVVKGRFSVTQIMEGQIEDGARPTLLCLSNAGSQDSEDWPLPEIPFDHVPVKPVESLYAMPNLDKPVPKTFCWKASASKYQGQEIQEWPSPPLSAIGMPMSVENVETYYTTEVQNADEVFLETLTTTEQTEDEANSQSDKMSNEEFSFSPPDVAKVLPYEDTAYLMTAAFENFPSEEIQHETPTCLSSTLSTASCLSSSFNATCSSSPKSQQISPLRKDSSPDSVIISQPTRSSTARSPISDSEVFFSDDAFMPGTVKVQMSPDETLTKDFLRKLSRCSNNSDISIEEIHSISGGTYMEDQAMARCSSYEPRLSTSSCKKCSHSSHSEEETSSLGTDLDGTVRMGLQQKKCTHSSHSEDTSIGLSISEWSTGTNTVKQYANLSGSDSISAISCAKSEKSHQTKSSISSINKSVESLNEQSGSFSNKFSGDNGSSEGLRYDILSASETDKLSETTSATKSDDTTLTLTEMAQSLSEWSTSSSKTIIGEGPPTTMEHRNNRRGNYNEFELFRQSRGLGIKSSYEENACALPQLHRKSESSDSNGKNGDGVVQRTFQHSNKAHITGASDMESIYERTSRPQKKRTLEAMSKRYQSHEITTESESSFVEQLYAPSEKFSERYQSQEFVPLQAETAKAQRSHPSSYMKVQKATTNPTQSTSSGKTQVTRPVMRALLKHMQEIGKTVDTENVEHGGSTSTCVIDTSISSSSVQSTRTILPAIMGQQAKKALATHQSYDDRTLSKSQILEYKTSKLRRTSSIQEAVPSSSHEAFQEVVSDNLETMRTKEQPERKGELLCLKLPDISPSSGNDTDSSLEIRIQDSKLRNRGYRKKRQAPTKSTRYVEESFTDNFVDKPVFDEQVSPDTVKNVEYVQYNSPSYRAMENPKKCSETTESVCVATIKRTPENHPMPPPTSQPVKPARSKKRQLKREDSFSANSATTSLGTYPGRAFCQTTESEVKIKTFSETRSSEESSEITQIQTIVEQKKKVLKLPAPDFFSDDETEPIEYERYACGLDIRVDPPPKYDGSRDSNRQ